MSIYLIRLSDWYSPPDDMYEITSSIISTSRCNACNKKLRFKSAIGHHAIPWGYGDLYCSWKCVSRKKRYGICKRRQRRLLRKLGLNEHINTIGSLSCRN